MIVTSSVGCRLLIVLRGTTAIISKNSGLGSIYLPPAATVIIDIIVWWKYSEKKSTLKRINIILSCLVHNTTRFSRRHICTGRGVDEHHTVSRIPIHDYYYDVIFEFYVVGSAITFEGISYKYITYYVTYRLLFEFNNTHEIYPSLLLV